MTLQEMKGKKKPATASKKTDKPFFYETIEPIIETKEKKINDKASVSKINVD
jgi:hypothetical protein